MLSSWLNKVQHIRTQSQGRIPLCYTSLSVVSESVHQYIGLINYTLQTRLRFSILRRSYIFSNLSFSHWVLSARMYALVAPSVPSSTDDVGSINRPTAPRDARRCNMAYKWHLMTQMSAQKLNRMIDGPWKQAEPADRDRLRRSLQLDNARHDRPAWINQPAGVLIPAATKINNLRGTWGALRTANRRRKAS